MSKYKVGDKVVLTVSDVNEKVYYPHYEFNNNFNLWKQSIDELVEPLSTYTEPLEAKIRRQAAEITRLLAENERLKAENKKMGVKLDAYELYGDQHEEEYNQAFNQGTEAAWELAKKIVLNNGYSVHDLHEIFDSHDSYHALENYTYQEAVAKVEAWEKAKEEIKVGDIIKVDVNGLYAIVTHESDEFANVVHADGNVYLGRKDGMTKTGRHIDIDSFLKQIGEE